MTTLTCWTGDDLETQPWVTNEQDTVGHLLIGTSTGSTGGAVDLKQLTITLDVQYLVDDDWCPLPEGSLVTTQRLDLPFFQQQETSGSMPDTAQGCLERLRHTADLRERLEPDPPNDLSVNRYDQFDVTGVPAGSLLRYAATATAPRGPTASSRTRHLWLMAPTFTAEDVVETRIVERSGDEAAREANCWVLMHREERVGDRMFDVARLDLLVVQHSGRGALDNGLPDVQVQLGDGPMVDVRRYAAMDEPEQRLVGVLVDGSTDSVVLICPRSSPVPASITISAATGDGTGDRDTVMVALAPPGRLTHRAPVGLMIVVFAIQGLNDLFETPLASYTPPRSFAEVTYSDERAQFSSKPESKETPDKPDGYRYLVKAQVDYRIPAVWAFNAGALLLLQRGLPTKLFAELTDAVDERIISPANAGFGAHRAAYYRRQTNYHEVVEGERLIGALLRPGDPDHPTNRIYFGDSRLYTGRPGELGALKRLRREGHVEYLVLDRSTVSTSVGQGRQLLLFNGDYSKSQGNHLWQDQATGLKLLLIEDTLRDQLLKQDRRQMRQGQLCESVRELFFHALHENRWRDRPQLFVVGDDVEHFCGNGWFDGSTGDSDDGPRYVNATLAMLCWLAQHPWVRAVTVEDPHFVQTYLTSPRLPVSTAIDATMDPGGITTPDATSPNAPRGAPSLHFDTFHQAWSQTRSPWLGCTLGELSERLERRLCSWPRRHRNALYRLAWLYYLSCTHESQWSKQPEDRSKRYLLDAPFRWEAEDFVISESLQQRNAWVYLNASIWATWAAQALGDETFVLDVSTVAHPGLSGPLLPEIRRHHGADRWWSKRSTRSTSEDGLYWDQDNLSTIVLYNRRALAVLDRCGGRMTQLFSLVGGRPISVSGTCKAYQFLRTTGKKPACDGQRVQNTVYTPNHSYVGTDLEQARPRDGFFLDQRRTRAGGGQDDSPEMILFPDNFNTYDCEVPPGVSATVRARYHPSPGPQAPVPQEKFESLLAEDGRRRRDGGDGVVWHDGQEFAKSFTLERNVLTVNYEGVGADHRVANEFTLDLLDQLQGGPPDSVGRTDDASAYVRRSSSSVTVTTTPDSGCHFVWPARIPGADHPPWRHRLLTSIVEIQPDTGAQHGPSNGTHSFSYHITLP